MVANVVHLQEQNPQLVELNRVFAVQRAAYRRRPMPSADERIANLGKLREALHKYQDQLAQAVSDDFGSRSLDETKIAEILTSIEGTKYYAKHVRQWMRPEKRSIGLLAMPGKASVFYQPLGVVGVIVPWNYPIFLATGPLMCALAAGNRVMIKMSGFVPKLADTFQQMISEVFDEDQVCVFTGRGEISEAFPKLPFDQITFTGSTNVGRTIMAEAAKNLTPVLLELGGKSPAIVHDSYAFADLSERLALGKCWNAGQTCVAPDYLLVPKGRSQEFAAAFTAQVSKMYPTMLNNPDYTSVINDKQYKRIQGYLDDARAQGANVIEINPAGEDFSQSRKIPMTMILGATPAMQVMQNEIFGPLLPVMEYSSLDDAIGYINDNPRPLALYYFDNNDGRAEYIAANTHSGGMCINETLTHVSVDDLPFGGVGASGMGKYHGHEGFLAMSNAKSVLEKPRFYAMRYALPPFNKASHAFIKNFLLK